MKVGIIGSGGREHAICHKLSNTKKIEKIYCFPGNAGTAEIAENITINLENIRSLLNNQFGLNLFPPQLYYIDQIFLLKF